MCERAEERSLRSADHPFYVITNHHGRGVQPRATTHVVGSVPVGMRHLWLILPLLLVAAGCGGRTPAGSAPPADLLRGLTFVGGDLTVAGQPHELVADTEVSVQFTDDDRLIARAGCNMMQAPVDTGDGKLTVENGLAMTEMGCDKPRHEQDKLIAGLLGDTPTWQLDGSTLTITAGEKKLTLTEESVVKPDQPLDGTTWTLDTMVDGQVAQSVPTSVPPVTAVFDGKNVQVDTHCNGVGGTYTVDGDTITIELGLSTLMACAEDIMLVEGTVQEVLADTVTYRIEADQLTLATPSGKELHLHAG